MATKTDHQIAKVYQDWLEHLKQEHPAMYAHHKEQVEASLSNL